MLTMIFLPSNLSVEDMLYDEQDLARSMDKIEQINFHQEIEAAGVKFRCYNAGHVLGAAMFMIEIAGVRVCRLCACMYILAHPLHLSIDSLHG